MTPIAGVIIEPILAGWPWAASASTIYEPCPACHRLAPVALVHVEPVVFLAQGAVYLAFVCDCGASWAEVYS